jgi:hypothetical protein
MTRSDDPVAEIRRLYYATSKQTILQDLARAIDLLKQLPSDDERERAAVFMDGLSQMRLEWGVTAAAGPGTPKRRRNQR